MKYYKNFDLTKYNSFRIKSLAKEIWFPETINELIKLIKKLKGEKFEVLAGGTNVLINETINKVICLRELKSIIEWHTQGYLIVTSNVLISNFIKILIKSNYSGVEELLGIPGTVGGGVVMNCGSGNCAISNYLRLVITIDYEGKTHCYFKKDLKFKRRYSILQDKKEIITYISFLFKKKGIKKNIINKIKKFRKNFPKKPSAGGIFVNWHSLKPYKDKLIGLSVGDAQVSNMVNIIINKGNATTKDVLQLIEKIKQIVKKPLKLEIKLLGFKNENTLAL